MLKNQKICVIGLGYIGLPTASLLATKGYQVLGVDIRPEIVEIISSGKIHIVEPGLDILVKSAVHSGNLTASLKPEVSDIYILAVPTPFKENHAPDMSYVESAAKSIVKLVKPGDLVILESTSPVGSTEFVKATIDAINPIPGVFYAHCPERVIPGKVLEELVGNDRVVGGVDTQSTEICIEFYKTFVEGEVFATDVRTAELCKLTENSFRDVNIAFANELSMICDTLKINVWELIKLANRHPRVKILQPGPGVGGHCIAVDPWFIVSSVPEQARLIRTARQVNDSKPEWVIHQVVEKAKKFKSPVIACMGVAFKPDIDDLRESPSLEIAHHLQSLNIGKILVCEPNVNTLKGLSLVNCEEAIEQADIILILVDHKLFKQLPKQVFLDKCVIDTKGLLQ